MTILEALKAAVGLNYPVDDLTYQKTLTDKDLDPAGTYDSTFTKPVELCAASIVLVLLGSAESIREGGYSISLGDKDALFKLYNYYVDKYPDDLQPLPKPTISNKTYLW